MSAVFVRSMTSTPTLKWAQRMDKVFVTFEVVGAKDVNVVLSDGLLSLDAVAGGTTYKLENMTLFQEIESNESKWFVNDRWRAVAACYDTSSVTRSPSVRSASDSPLMLHARLLGCCCCQLWPHLLLLRPRLAWLRAGQPQPR